MTIAEMSKAERIRHEFARDLAEQPMAIVLQDIPAFYENMTPEWLTAVVRQRHPGATVSGFTLDDPDTGTSNRRRVFLEYDEANTEKGYPASLFCKASQDLLNRMVMSTAAANAEVLFYNTVRPELEIEAPICYLAAIDRTSYRSIIVLRDMRGEVEFCGHATPMSLPRVKNQLSLLATMHARYYESPEFADSLASVDSFPARFHRLDREHDLETACDAGFMAASAVIPASVIARRADIWPLTLKSVDSMELMPSTLCHGDVHLKNWYIRSDDQVGLNDFQVLNRGHWSRDVAYAMVTALTSTDRQAWERELLAFYLAELHAKGGPSVAFDDCWRWYRQQMFSVLAWWTITMNPAATMPDMQPIDTTLHFLQRIGQAMEDLQVFDAFA